VKAWRERLIMKTWRVEGRITQCTVGGKTPAGYIISADVSPEGDGPDRYVGMLVPYVNALDPEDVALLVAAPDLLAALRGALGALEFSRDYHSDLNNAEQAFAQDRLDAAVKAIKKATEKI